MKVGKKVSSAIDVEVGKRIRFRRKQCGLSQSDIANVLGLTFQQIQKYENGGNRVSASRLATIAATLNVPLSYFFEGVDKPGDASDPTSDEFSKLFAPESMDLNRAFMRIEDHDRRRAVLRLIKGIAEMGGQEQSRDPE